MTDYKINDTSNLAFNVTLDGVLTDPTAIDAVVTSPSGVVNHYAWPSGAVVRVDQGSFTLGFPLPEAGVWNVVINCSGAVTDTQALAFSVGADTVAMIFKTEDQVSANVAGAHVEVFSNPLTLVAAGLTDTIGNFLCNLLPGTYIVYATKAKAMFPNPFNVTVSAAATVILQGTVLAITETAAAKLVRLFGHMIGADGRALVGARVIVSTVGYGTRSNVLAGSGADTGIDPTNLTVASEKRELNTDAQGYWEVDVVALSTVRVYIPATRSQKTFRVPSNVVTLNFADARPDPGPGGDVGIDFDAPQREDPRGGG